MCCAASYKDALVDLDLEQLRNPLNGTMCAKTEYGHCSIKSRVLPMVERDYGCEKTKRR